MKLLRRLLGSWYGALIVFAMLSGSVTAAVTFRSAIPFGTASSWSSATGSDSNAVRGPWFNTSGNAFTRANGVDWQIDQVSYSVIAYGADPTGVLDSTSAINSALTAASAAGGEVYLPPGTYTTTSSLNVGNNTTLRMGKNTTINSSAANCIVVSGTNIRLNGGTLSMTSIGATQYGINPSGTVTNLIVDGVTVTGTGAAADAQTGFGNNSGPTITNLVITNSVFSNLTVGISLNADLAGAITGARVSGNKVLHSVGTSSGQGYGIHHANGSGNPSMVLIEGNEIETCQRHSIYQARGSGVAIIGNRILNHRQGVGAGVQRPAISIGRSNNVTVVGNVIEAPADAALDVFTDSLGTVSYNITITGNIIRNWTSFAAFVIGTSAPATDSFPTDIIISGNAFYNDLSITGSSGSLAAEAIYFQTGKRINVIGNSFNMSNAASATNMIEFAAIGESGASNTYSDQFHFEGNQVFASGTNPRTFRMDALFCASIARADFINDVVNTTGATFSRAAAQANPNIYVFNHPVDGLDVTANHTIDAIRKWVDVSYGSTTNIDASLGDVFNIGVTNGTGFTVANPTNPRQTGQQITITIKNISGGALGTLTWDTLYKVSTWTQPANANNRSITFFYNGSNWIEQSRVSADIPN